MNIQDICDAAWAYPTRTLNAGSFGTPTTYLEEICLAVWTEAERTLTTAALSLADDAIDLEAPFTINKHVHTAVPTGGTAPYLFERVSSTLIS